MLHRERTYLTILRWVKLQDAFQAQEENTTAAAHDDSPSIRGNRTHVTPTIDACGSYLSTGVHVHKVEVAVVLAQRMA